MTARNDESTAATIPRRLGWKAGATTMAVALAAAGAAIGLSGTAGASTCTLGAPLGACSTTGTATVSPGTLTMVAPPTLTWGTTISDASQTVYDTLDADTTLDAIDLRGLASTDPGSGWNITATATPFIATTHTGAVIPDDTTARCSPLGAVATQQPLPTYRPRSAPPQTRA